MTLIELITAQSARLKQAGVSFGHGTTNAFEKFSGASFQIFKRFGVNWFNNHPTFVHRPRVYEGFPDGFIGVLQFIVFPNKTNADFLKRIFEFSKKIFPFP